MYMYMYTLYLVLVGGARVTLAGGNTAFCRLVSVVLSVTICFSKPSGRVPLGKVL